MQLTKKKPTTKKGSSFSFKKLGSKKQSSKSSSLISLDIGSFYTKMLVGKQTGNTLIVESALKEKTPNKACADGTVVNASSIASTLNKVISQSNTKTKDVVFTIESTKIIKREFVIHKIPEEDILGLVKHEMGQYLPIDIAGYSIQPSVTGSLSEDDGEKLKVSVNAVPKEMMKQYQQLLTSIGLNPVSMSLNSNSIEKLITFDKKHNPHSEYSGKNVVFIDMGYSCFNISVYEDGVYQFNRDIEVGGEKLDNMIADTLRINLDEAQDVKVELCSQINAVELDQKYSTMPPSYEPKNTNDRVLSNLSATINEWAGQIDKVLQYQIRSRGKNIDEIYLYGGSSLMSGIGGFFESKLAIKTGYTGSVGYCKYPPNINPQDLFTIYGNAVGAFIKI